ASTVAPRLVLYSTTVRAQPRLLFFSQPPATPELYTLSLHDALPILALPALELATGFVDHPFANANDQASLFGQRNEAVRHDQLARGMAPANQRLDTGDPAVVGRHARLVMQFEFFITQRTVQLHFELGRASCRERVAR